MRSAIVILCIAGAVFLGSSMVNARGGGRGGGGRGGGSRGSSSRGSSSRGSSSRGSSSTSTTSTSRNTGSSSSSSMGWRNPSTTSSASTGYGWRNPSTTSTSTSSNYGWRNPSSNSGSSSAWPWNSPSTTFTNSGSRLPGTTLGGTNRFLYSGGGSGSSGRATAFGLGALAGSSRFRTRTRYRGGGFSFESNSIEDRTVPARTVVLSSSQSGTCNNLVTQRNVTRPSATINVTIYENDDYRGQKKVVQLPPRQCVNVHLVDPDWNDKASSIDPGEACVMIWEHIDCTGRFACFRNGTRGANSFRLVGMNDDLTSLQLC